MVGHPRKNERRRAMDFVVPALLGAATLAGAIGIGLQSSSGGPVALVFPPWWSGKQSIEAAATVGAIVRVGAFAFIVVVAPYDPDPQMRLTQAGAWFSVDPQSLGACATRGALDWNAT